MEKLRYYSLAVAMMMFLNSVAGTWVVWAMDEGTNETNSQMLSAEESSDNLSEERANDREENGEETGAESIDVKEDSDEETEETPTDDRAGVVGNIIIKSFNPGYTNQGEFFELSKLSNKPILLAGLTVIYTTSSGKEYEVYKFPEESEMVGESLLLRLSSADEVKEADDPREVADAVYTRNMAQGKGKIELRYLEERLGFSPGDGESPGELGFLGALDPKTGTFETLCWGFSDARCYPGFSSAKPTTLVRNFLAEEIEDLYQHESDYIPSYNLEAPGLVFREIPEEKAEPKCRNLEFSEIFTYFENSAEEQFVEIFNRSEEATEVSECALKYKNKIYFLREEDGEISSKERWVEANAFLLVYPVREFGLNLSKNPTNVNTLEIIDTDGEAVDSLSYFSGQRKGVSLAMFGWTENGQEIWKQTFSLTPGEENVFQEFKACPVGKVINLETGNCVNETNLAPTLAACPEGKYRNLLTGRCKSYETTASTELKPCAEGYERNPETGRCRKIVKNNGAEFPVETEEIRGRRELVAIWAIIAVIFTGVGYILFQYREEIKKLFF